MTQRQQTLPRGIRNNNPGNIRHSGARWEGLAQQQTDENFVTFTAPEYGVRALARILINYQVHHHLDTTEQIIHRWAPPTENLTDAYVRAVARAVGVNPADRVDLRNNRQLLTRFVDAIISHENGSGQWYERNVIDLGVTMATESLPQHHEDRSAHHVHHRHHKHHKQQHSPSGPRIVLP